jgi:hypothetical protein
MRLRIPRNFSELIELALETPEKKRKKAAKKA